MDKFSREDLVRLLTSTDPQCVSIYLPTHRGGRENMQDPIRLRNLLNQAEDQLVAADLRYAEARELLEPARRLVQDAEFWRNQVDGLALFVSKSGMHRYRVPQTMREMAIVSPRFHVTPLLPLLAEEGRFFVLGLSNNVVRLLECSRQDCRKVNVPDMPASFDEVGKYIEIDQGVHRRQEGGDITTAGRQAPQMFAAHGHGGADTEKKTWLPEFCRMVERAVTRHIQESGAPLILAATEPLAGMYREMNTYRQLAPEGVPGNTDHMTEAQLHEKAWPVAQPHLAAEREKTVQAYAQVKGTPRATNLLDVVLQAAQEGRVMSLLLAVDSPVWGKYDPQTSRIELHSRVEPGDEDLLNAAAVLVQTHGGNVHGLPRSQMPDDKPVAAVFRY